MTNNFEEKIVEAFALWHARMKKIDPDHADLFCQHGEYRGRNRLFTCEKCSDSEI